MSEEAHGAFKARAEQFSTGDLVRMLAQCSELESNGSLRRTGRPRVLIEMLLLRMSYLDKTLELESVIRALGGEPIGKPQPARPASPPNPEPVPQEVDSSGPVQAEPGGEATPPEASPSTGRKASVGLVQGWAALLDDPSHLPPGLRPFLRAAKVEEVDRAACVSGLPEGPAHERLRDVSDDEGPEGGVGPSFGRGICRDSGGRSWPEWGSRRRPRQ